MTSLPNGAEYPIEPFKWGLPVSKFDVSSIPMTDDIYIFKLVILLTLNSSKLIVILMALDKLKLTLHAHFYYCGQVTVTLLSLGETKNPRTTQLLVLAQVIYNGLISRNEELVSQFTNRLQRFNLLFRFVTRFSDLCDKIKYAWWE